MQREYVMHNFINMRSKTQVSPAVRAVCISAYLLTATISAHGSNYSDALKARNYHEAERAVNAALAANPHDAAALAAKVDVLLASAPETRTDEAVTLAEQCIAAQPRQSECHEALGNALGTKALGAGVFSALGYAGKIRDAFRRAIELNPRNFTARFSLLQYYLTAPGIVGGSVDNARTLAAETGKLNFDAGQLMLALININQGDVSKAERVVQATYTSTADPLDEERRDVLWTLGGSYLNAKRYADAERIFHDLQARFPNSELGSFGIARALQEQGHQADAIPLFENAARIYPRTVIYYRLGQALQATGANAKALVAYEKALALAPALPAKQLADAGQQMKKLKE
jgi:tetratricopeptide (TPR) repeat protein